MLVMLTCLVIKTIARPSTSIWDPCKFLHLHFACCKWATFCSNCHTGQMSTCPQQNTRKTYTTFPPIVEGKTLLTLILTIEIRKVTSSQEKNQGKIFIIEVWSVLQNLFWKRNVMQNVTWSYPSGSAHWKLGVGGGGGIWSLLLSMT